MKEYGSKFDWQSNSDFLRDDGQGGLGLDGGEYFRSGRDALRSLAQMTGKWPKLVVMPALCCESMIVPFEQNGYKIEFYKLREDMTADTEDVASKLRDGAMLLYMRYMGIPQLSDQFLQSLRDGFSELIIVEDRTQDILTPRAEGGFRPDAVLASLRKWAALPEGAVLFTALEHRPGVVRERFGKEQRAAMEAKSRWIAGSKSDAKEEYLRVFHEAEELLDVPGEPTAITAEYRALIERLDFAEILRRRRENIAVLKERLAPLAQAGKLRLLTDSPEQSGLYMPILLEDRPPVLQRMFDLAIYCPPIWPAPEQTKGVCPVSRYVAEHSVCLICDQRYNGDDMRYIADVLTKALE